MLDRIKNARNIHIIGISGTEGSAIALFLQKQKIPFTAHDFSEEKRFKRNFLSNHFGIPAKKRQEMLIKIEKLNNHICFKENYLKGVEKADLIFVSQNWEAYKKNRKLQKLFTKYPHKFATITQFYFQFFPGKIIAITGTNGKSTTAKLIAEIMQKSNRQSWFTGNDRRNIQILDSINKWKKDDWLVVEVSNRQLKFDLGRAPDIAVITNVTKNHLSEYGGSFMKYKNCKYSLINNQDKSQVAVLNYDNSTTKSFAKKLKSTHLFFSTMQKLSRGLFISDKKIVFCDKKTTHVLPVDKISLLGDHGLSNTLAAVTATRMAGVTWPIIRKAIASFRGIEQRLELVAKKRGVNFINDTAATTPESTIAAIKSFPKNTVHLIAGGDAKGMNYNLLVKEIKNRGVQTVLLKSPVASLLSKELRKLRIKFKLVKTLQEAIKTTSQFAKKGDYVLLSPSAAWFCYFKGKIPLGGRGFELFIKKLV